MAAGRDSRPLIYAALAAIGAAAPLAAFLPWLVANGFSLHLFVTDLFANRISAFFGLDVIVSAIVLTRFVRVETGVPGRWWAVLATFTVGVSCGLPLFLAVRERTQGGHG